MGLIEPGEYRFAEAVAKITYSNPFTPDRIRYEAEALGDEFDASEAVWSYRGGGEPGPGAAEGAHAPVREVRPNMERILERAQGLAEVVRERLRAGKRGSPEEMEAFEGLLIYLLYRTFASQLERVIVRRLEGRDKGKKIDFWPAYRAWGESYLVEGANFRIFSRLAHVFACFFHVRRVWHHVYHYIIGGSMAAAKLRAAIWQSACTYDMRRYHDLMYDKMGEFNTLVTGPSGTGKELVARAIGMSRYIPFDPKTQTFALDFALQFHALNLSALPPHLIESELFGHRRGAFTGAIEDREGWLEACHPLGTVFLDELGELDVTLQVKLLRVLQNRTFQRIGESTERRFQGKIIAATNRDLVAEMQAGTFRQDLFYRLCSDMIVTPSLREQLVDAPEELGSFVHHILARIVGGEAAAALREEVTSWILRNLGPDYPWPGNMRELEQCVRNVLIRRDYAPPSARAPRAQAPAAGTPAAGTPAAGLRGPGGPLATGRENPDLTAFLEGVAAGDYSAEALLNRYAKLVYARAGSYEAAARALGLDRRTVKRRVEAATP